MIEPSEPVKAPPRPTYTFVATSELDALHTLIATQKEMIAALERRRAQEEALGERKTRIIRNLETALASVAHTLNLPAPEILQLDDRCGVTTDLPTTRDTHAR